MPPRNPRPMRIFVAALLLSAGVALRAAPVPHNPLPAPPSIGATSYVLYDYRTGGFLVSEDAHEHVEPASITKLMTAYVVFRYLESGQIKLGDQVRVSRKAWKTPGSRMFIKVGTKVSVDDLLKGLIVDAGNDAAMALAEHVAGSEALFVRMMNRNAARLHMEDTHYANASGLPGMDQRTSAHDTALLFAALIRDFPRYYRYYSLEDFTYNGITQHNRNWLVARKHVDGGQTGHTDSAGYCLATSAHDGPMRLVAVVMGADSERSRAAANEALLRYGFRFYRSARLYAPGDNVTQATVWEGARDQVGVGVRRPVWVTYPRGRRATVDTSFSLEPDVVAPVARGDELGSLTVSVGKRTVAKRPLLALNDVARGSLWEQAKDYIYRLVQENVDLPSLDSGKKQP